MDATVILLCEETVLMEEERSQCFGSCGEFDERS